MCILIGSDGQPRESRTLVFYSFMYMISPLLSDLYFNIVMWCLLHASSTHAGLRTAALQQRCLPFHVGVIHKATLQTTPLPSPPPPPPPPPPSSSIPLLLPPTSTQMKNTPPYPTPPPQYLSTSTRLAIQLLCVIGSV